uniref:NADH dehydrogenase [ubiquinone] 1 beta subcomplex subunit 11, mitochondrial n=1 Tax=Salarias fasciatus TaxID=181472 RepID=A0A672JI52_SALFA
MLTKKRREERGEVVSGSGTTVSFADKNVVPLSRLAGLSRLGSVPRLLSSQQLRFVSQSKPAGSTAVTELHRPGNEGHGEVSPYLKNPDYHGFSSDPVEDTLNMRVGLPRHLCGSRHRRNLHPLPAGSQVSSQLFTAHCAVLILTKVMLQT